MERPDTAPDGMLPFPVQGLWDALEDMTAEELAALLPSLLRQREEMDAREPEERDEEAYEAWAEAHEELEDLIDEVTDRLEG